MDLLKLACTPLVALWPPLGALSRTAAHVPLLRVFALPPRLRFLSFELSNVAFLLCMTFLELPITRNPGRPARDWFLLLWATAHLLS